MQTILLWLLSFVILLVAAQQHRSIRHINSAYKTDGIEKWTGKQYQVSEELSVQHEHEKRGLGDIIFTGFYAVVRAASLIVTLGNTLSDGCWYYPSICSNRDKIASLENSIKALKRNYEHVYFDTKKTFFRLKTAITNNGYIQYHINKSMETIESMQSIEEKIADELDIKFRISSKIQNSVNESFDNYLKAAVGQFEFTLQDLQKEIQEKKKMALIYLAVGYLVEISVNRFMKSFGKAYQQTLDAEDILATTQVGFLFDEEITDSLKNAKKPGFFSKIKLVPKAMKQMLRNAGKSVKNFVKDVKKWGKIKSWKGFKGKVMHSLAKPIQKLKNAKNFVLNGAFRTKFVDNYKLKWSQRIGMGIGIVMDVITQVLAAKEWNAVADKMNEARKNHEEYYENLKKELQGIISERKKMNTYMVEVIDIFRTLTVRFRSLIANQKNYSNFTKVVGKSKIPIDTNNPLFTIDFNNVNSQSIIAEQSKVISFLKSVNNDLTSLEDEMKARLILYRNTLAKSKENETVENMLRDVKNILYLNLKSETMQKYGEKLNMKDMVCTVSILRYGIMEYDFFPLERFRPNCNVNTTIFEVWKAEAGLKRRTELMKSVVLSQINRNTNESVSRVLDAVHNAYSGVRDTNLEQFGKSVNEQDIVCMIADNFHERERYDFIDLTSLRQNCSMISTESFKNILDKASKLKSLFHKVKKYLNLCIDEHYCRCLSSVAKQHAIDEEDVVHVLIQIDHNWQPNKLADYCGSGPTRCDCKHF